MTTAIKERSQSSPSAGRLFDPDGGRSLDDVISIAWEQLEQPEQDPLCMICGEPLVWDGDERAAECESCGSRLE